MVWRILSNCSLLLLLWIYALKTTTYVLNQLVPNKRVPKISYELYTETKSILRLLRVWGYPEEVNSYNPHEKT